jgi:hypothetical protein
MPQILRVLRKISKNVTVCFKSRGIKGYNGINTTLQSNGIVCKKQKEGLNHKEL